MKRVKLFFVTIFLSFALLLAFLFKTNSNNNTRAQAIAKVKTQSEVMNYLKRVPQGLIEIDNQENNSYLIHVYEVKNGHTATFNWYRVDKITGEVKKEL